MRLILSQNKFKRIKIRLNKQSASFLNTLSSCRPYQSLSEIIMNIVKWHCKGNNKDGEFLLSCLSDFKHLQTINHGKTDAKTKSDLNLKIKYSDMPLILKSKETTENKTVSKTVASVITDYQQAWLKIKEVTSKEHCILQFENMSSLLAHRIGFLDNFVSPPNLYGGEVSALVAKHFPDKDFYSWISEMEGFLEDFFSLYSGYEFASKLEELDKSLVNVEASLKSIEDGDIVAIIE